ncbi:hypothetical protein GCM10025870_05030 [Agromyces marinus]|uniref:Uncharacterized protein n=1 Tax=Agromyces marinus TaxID=1389020 RepID=A0ABN6YBW7_9MICO|nr:hypothetical protein GCM10025870_05030 [Agromyces marinus]
MHAHADAAAAAVDERVGRHDELDVRAGVGRRFDHGDVRQVESVELVVVGEGDHDVRIAHVDADPGARDGQVLRAHERLAAVEAPEAQVGLEASGRRAHPAHPGTRADRDPFAVDGCDEPLVDEEAQEHADAVAAHLGRAAVGVPVVHEPRRARILRECGFALGQSLGAHRPDEPVGADAEPAIAHGRDPRGVERVLPVGVAGQHEVVARALALGEAQIERHRTSLGSGRGPVGPPPALRRRSGCVQATLACRATSAATAAGSRASTTDAAAYRRNHPTCLRA